MECFVVSAQVVEIQIGELQHGLQVLDGAVAADAFGVVVDIGIHSDVFSSKDLGEVNGAEVANAANAHQGVDFLEGIRIVLVKDGEAAKAVGAHQDLIVFEVGGLVDDLHAVVQREHGGVEVFEDL